jgi:hypothetical protein
MGHCYLKQEGRSCLFADALKADLVRAIASFIYSFFIQEIVECRKCWAWLRVVF